MKQKHIPILICDNCQNSDIKYFERDSDLPTFVNCKRCGHSWNLFSRQIIDKIYKAIIINNKKVSHELLRRNLVHASIQQDVDKSELLKMINIVCFHNRLTKIIEVYHLKALFYKLKDEEWRFMCNTYIDY